MKLRKCSEKFGTFGTFIPCHPKISASAKLFAVPKVPKVPLTTPLFGALMTTVPSSANLNIPMISFTLVGTVLMRSAMYMINRRGASAERGSQGLLKRVAVECGRVAYGGGGG